MKRVLRPCLVSVVGRARPGLWLRGCSPPRRMAVRLVLAGGAPRATFRRACLRKQTQGDCTCGAGGCASGFRILALARTFQKPERGVPGGNFVWQESHSSAAPARKGLASRSDSRSPASLSSSARGREEKAEEAVHEVKSAVPEARSTAASTTRARRRRSSSSSPSPTPATRPCSKELAEDDRRQDRRRPVVPMTFGEERPVPAPPEAGSAAQEAQALLPKAKL